MRRVTYSIVFIMLALAALSVGLAGCGNNPKPTPTAGGGLKFDEAKLAKGGEPRYIGSGSPGQAVLTFWKDIQAGAAPDAMLMFDSKVRAQIGLAPLAGTIVRMKAELATFRPYVESTRKVACGKCWLVTITAVSVDAISPRHSYMVRKKGRDWQILYDSLTDETLRRYVTDLAESKSGGKGANPSKKSVAQGEEAATRFRLAALASAD